ncbi:hypothetical protein [Thiothrix subterranea]|uniref:Uncharacterized protein n=1 Tax=Thiothrix subterranea TaxID=2735563 RepID=A0AA51MKJ5_9GAMM|nr:hypothetical protein [Thiothrix subterranea]MDQ5769590.1 hypothetical protein [Thiothrix subterranea]QQZ27371.1 hypothetical protein HMY34_00585 [Thiothrix subterranea]WML85663.1 hypothetical protein RCG00_15325 [Thiothrix subterranea]
MKKTYTIQSVTHNAISPQKGSMVWQLLDADDGRLRKVNGVTTLDNAGLVDSVRSIYAREIPLVDELLLHDSGDSFTIDFSEFNQQQGYVERDMYLDMQNCEQLSNLSRRTWRVIAVVVLLVVLWLSWMLNTSMTKFAEQQPLIHKHELP